LLAIVGPGWTADRGSSKPAGPVSQPAAPSAQIAAPITKPAGAPPSNQTARRAESDVVTLNFINADIEGVVKVMTEITGKSFVLDPRAKGTVTIISTKPMQRALVYDVFLSALRLQGFAAVEDSGIVSIVAEADAKLHASPIFASGESARIAGDRIETRIFILKYESAAQLLPVLRPLIAPNNTITAYQNSNTLVVTDYANNLRRIAKIIDSIDQPSGIDPVVIALKYASAVDVAQTVNRLFTEIGQGQGGADPTQRFIVIADVRSNSLLVRSGDPSRLDRLRKFVTILDSPTSAAGNIHVVYLKNAEAVKLAELLRAIYSGEVAAPAVASRPMTQTALAASMSSGQNPGVSPSFGNNQGASPATAPGIIQADPATNSLIITAPDAIYNNMRAALEKLDVRRAQIFVEALIVELTASKAAEFGIQWQSLKGLSGNSTQAFGGTNFGSTGQNIIGVAANPSTIGTGLNVGIVDGTLAIPGFGTIANLGVLARALETDADANILSTPTLLTLDNEEAKIIIGQNVPFVTGSYAVSGAATTPTPFTTVERHDVGLTLQIKPQISEGGTVRLQIYQEVSTIDDKTNLTGIIINKRAVQSTILVDDKQIVVIGGLIDNRVTEGVQKVPLLGDIPVLGALFRYKTRSYTKTNLMIFLRPTLVRNSEDSATYSGERYDYIRGEQIKASPVLNSIQLDMKSPILAPRSNSSVPAPSKDQKPAQ